MSAGLLTVLSIQDTKRETINTALKRLYAFFIAFFISIICFKLFGYGALSFGIYLFIFVNICMIFDLKIAVVPVSVLVTHLVSEESIRPSIILNEFLLFVIGVGIGMIINMHLHNDNKKMSVCRENLDCEIKTVIERMSVKILDGDKSDYNGECFNRIDLLMFEAQKIALENHNNNIRKSETYDLQYLDMRKKQCCILREMYKCILRIDTPPQQAMMISRFLKKTSIEYHEQNDVRSLIDELDKIFEKMTSQPMPVKRTEFENRAVLFSFMLHLKDFLVLKYEFACKLNTNFVEK